MATETGGVKAMPIGGRMVRERERLIGMTAEERAWRKQYLKDFELHEGPRTVKALELELSNPIRQFYRAPLDKLCDALTPSLGYKRAYAVRYTIGKIGLVVAGLYSAAYYFKYNKNDWTRKGGWRVIHSRPACNPGDPEFPKLSDRTVPADYASRKFKDSPI